MLARFIEKSCHALFQIKATSCVENTLDPVWDNVVEFCTADYTKTVVSLVLHDKDVTTLETLRIKDDPDDFMGSCNFYLTKVGYLSCQ